MFNLSYKFILLVVSFLVIFSQKSFSQAGPSFSVTTFNTSFFIGTTSQLTSANTIASSFSLNVTNGSKGYNLLIGITSKSYNPSSAQFSSIPLSVSLRSVSGVSNTSGGISGTIPLSEYPPNYTTLVSNAAKTGINNTATWTYDLILSPIGFTIPPGTYIYTVTVQYNDQGNVTINRTFTISLNVQSVVNVSLIQNSPATVNFGSSSAYVNGVTSLNFHSLQVQSNIPWLINVTAPQYFSAGSSGASSNMPCSIMAIRRNGSGTFVPLSTSSQTLSTGVAGDNNAAGNTTSYDMQFNPGYDYNPGIYNISLTYTISSQ